MNIITLTGRCMESNCYLLVEQEHAIVIDPGDAELLLPIIKAKKLHFDFGILTHEHCDHVFGCTALQHELGIMFYASETCDRNLRDARRNFSQYYEAFVSIQTKVPVESQIVMPPFTTHADHVFTGEMELDWQGHKFLMHETPGHSPGSICILLDKGILFSGDTVLPNDLTGLRFTGGSRKRLQEETLPWLSSLPKEAMVYPGHGPAFNLGERLLEPIVED